MAATATTEPLFPLMDGGLPTQADVVVVGGGVVGLCVALYLAEAGREVVVIERNRVGGTTSEGNACLVSPSHSVPFPAISAIRDGLRWMVDGSSPFYVRPTLRWSRIEWLLRFARASTAKRSLAGTSVLSRLLLLSAELFDRDVDGHEELECEYRKDGVLNVHESPASMERGLAEAELLAPFGIESEPIEGAEMARREPLLSPALAGGIVWPQDGHMDPALFVSRLSSLLARRGVRVYWSTELLGLARERGRVRSLRTTAGEIEPGELVLAAGAWSPAISRQLGLRLAMQPGKGYSLTAATRGPVLRRPILFADARVVATPLAGRLRLAGTLELVGRDMHVSTRRVQAIRDVADRLLHGVEIDPQARIWRGLRPLTADGLPVIGRARGLANVALATGHGHLGLSLAPVTGRLIAELLAGEAPSVDLRPLSPDRF